MKDKKDKIYYFQEKSNDILDLQDELNAEEIGIYFILKAGYFKYSGELKKENANQRCKFFGDLNKFNSMISKLFDEIDGLLVNNSWLSEIKGIKDLSEKRKKIAESRWGGKQKVVNASKTEAKPKQNRSKTEANVNVNPNVNVNVESKLIISPIYKELADGLLFVLESKLQRKLSSRNWENEIKKLIEIDLSVRQNPLEDVKRAIQTIADNYGKNYFPIIQSAESLRQKFTKIEDYVKRNNSLQNQKLTKDQQQDLINKQLEEAYANNQDF